MKRIPLRIFVIVLLTGLIGVGGMMVLKYNIDMLSNTYHKIIDEHAVNEDYMKSITASLYQHQAQVMNHILADSEDMYVKYETKEEELRDKIEEELSEFGAHMQIDERARLYHKVYSNYYSYLRNVDIVLGLSRSGDKNMATYYVNTSMVKFLENVDRDLEELDGLTIQEMNNAKRYMNGLITVSRASEMICIACILVAVVICLFFCFKLTTKLENARKEADAANQSKSLFLAKMSHEIRTPINAIIGMNEMILREEDREEILDYAMDVKRSAYTLLSTINDILDLSKIESGKMELVLVEYDFSTLLYDIVNMISMKAKDKGLEVVLSLDEQLPSRLYGDDVRLRQILINLLNNAVKYTEEGSVTLSVHGQIQDSKVKLLFEVQDTGIGIKKEDLTKLFAEFERIEEKRNRNVEGTGLGMSIATQLLSLMDSHLQVESVYGEGSRFYFSVEQEIVDKEPIGDIKERIREQVVEYNYDVNFIAPDVRLLVVDDNMVNRKVLVNLLKEQKIQIDEAAGGYECLEMITKKHYDLIFLDHMMPELDGLETIKRILKLPENLCRDVPVIALTANALSGAKEMYISNGFTDYLPKPFQPDKLEEMLLEYLPKDKIIAMDSSERQVKKKYNPISDFSEQGFPAIDGMDWKAAALVQQDAESLKNTIEIFLQLLLVDADALEGYYEQIVRCKNSLDYSQDEIEEAWKQYRVKVHAMKSSAALIGAVSLSGVAHMLEELAGEHQYEQVCMVTPVFLQQWRSYDKRLYCFAPQKDDEEKVPFDASVFMELLPQLDEALEDMDVDTADDIVDKLKKYELTDEIELLMDKLATAVMNLDAQEEQEVAKQIMERIKPFTNSY